MEVFGVAACRISVKHAGQPIVEVDPEHVLLGVLVEGLLQLNDLLLSGAARAISVVNSGIVVVGEKAVVLIKDVLAEQVHAREEEVFLGVHVGRLQWIRARYQLEYALPVGRLAVKDTIGMNDFMRWSVLRAIIRVGHDQMLYFDSLLWVDGELH